MISLITLSWLGVIFFLFLYSFTQIDLGLTLTQVNFWQIIQKGFQQIGYFNRPFSTKIYLTILFLLYCLYFLILNQIKKGKIKTKKIWLLIFFTAGILWFSYNAFSYDLFNYIMDAKIVTYYRKNPYTHKALDFPEDPMLGFMHWTHRYYPYGPLWLLITIPLSFLSFQKLIPSMILIKGLGVFGYLITCYSIFKILKKIKISSPVFGLAVFAFNPLVIIESLVSAHNDILMMGLATFAFWLLLEKKYKLSWLLFFISVGIKFVTILLLPLFIIIQFIAIKKTNIEWKKIWLWAIFLMFLGVILASIRTELQPWYLLYVFPFLSFVYKEWVFYPLISLSAGLLLHYAPFLYLGNWNNPVPFLKKIFTFISLIFGFLIFIFGECYNKLNEEDP